MNLLKLRDYQKKLKRLTYKKIKEGEKKIINWMHMGCLTGDTIIHFNRGGEGIKRTLEKSYLAFNGLRSNVLYNWRKDITTYTRSDKNGTVGLNEVLNIVYCGKKIVHKLTLENGKTINATIDHKFLTSNGYKALKKLIKNELIAVDQIKAIGKNKKNKKQGVLEYSKIVKIEKIGLKDTYDMSCKAPYNNYVANGMVVHNSGKGLSMPDYCLDALKRNKKVLVVMRRKDIVYQTKENFYNHRGIKTSMIMASEKGYEKDNPIQICSIDTIRNRIKKPEYAHLKKFDLVLIDECHDSTSPTYASLFEFLDDKPIYIGFTATPFATGNKPLLFWKDIIKPINPSELRDQGYLVPVRIYRPSIIDTTGIKKQAGDFAISELFELVNNLKIIGDAVEAYQKFGNGKPFIGFCVNIKHSKIMAKAFNDSGIQSVHIDQSSSKEDRLKAKQDLIDGKIKGIFNVNIFSTGWDCPMVEVEIGLRPTLSENLALQQWGRVIRSSPGKKEAIILDHANNTSRHGFPYDDLRTPCLTELAFDKKRKEDRKDIVKVKDCPECGLTVEFNLSKCWGCDYIFAPIEKEIKHEAGELVEVKEEKEIDKLLNYLNTLINQEKKHGNKKVAKYYKLHSKFGNVIFNYTEELNLPKWFESSAKKMASKEECQKCKRFSFTHIEKYESRFLGDKSKIRSYDLGYCRFLKTDVKKKDFCISFIKK